MPDWAGLGALEGLDPEGRNSRTRLLDELHQEGVEVDELIRAAREGRLAVLVIEAAIGGGRAQFTLREASEQSGMELDWLIRGRQALGLAVGDADEVTLSQADVDSLQIGMRMRETGLPEETILDIYRALGGAMARYTDALRTIVTGALLSGGGTEWDVAERFRGWMSMAMPQFGPALEYAGRAHLIQRLRQDLITYEEIRSGRLRTTVDVTVAFVDVVGFTQMGEELPEEELGSIASLLVAAGTDLAQPPVRLVKSIGDALMLISSEPAPLVEAVLTLVEDTPALPDLRGGLAFGPAVNRDGDWYGAAVNLASRLCDRARPGSVLAPADLADRLDDSFSYSEAGPKRLKGISHPVPALRVRRPADR